MSEINSDVAAQVASIHELLQESNESVEVWLITGVSLSYLLVFLTS